MQLRLELSRIKEWDPRKWMVRVHQCRSENLRVDNHFASHCSAINIIAREENDGSHKARVKI